jgi:hypothetical protein
MSGNTTHFKTNQLCAMASLAVVLGAALIAAAPARADHDHGPDVGFHFFFGFPPPPPPEVVIYGPPPVYYYEPAPRVVVQHRPYYRTWRYQERDYRHDNWRGHRHSRYHRRYHRDHDDD